jgi:hypothetical protein
VLLEAVEETNPCRREVVGLKIPFGPLGLAAENWVRFAKKASTDLLQSGGGASGVAFARESHSVRWQATAYN